MWGTALSLFTGTSKWLYIALIALSIAFISVSTLSISLYVDKAVLASDVFQRDKQIKEKDTLANVQAEKIEALIKQVSEKRKEIDLVNEVAKQNAIDKEKNDKIVKAEKTEIEEKYKTLRDSLNKWQGDKNATSCQNAVNFVNSLIR